MGSRILAGRYELLEKIGEGGMAVVFRAKDRVLSRFVAVKILRPEYTKDQQFIESFRKESQLAASIVDPNIVNVYDVGREGNIYYIVMELVEGFPLSDTIKHEAPLDSRRAVAIARQIAMALATAHKHHLIHRDVKPHNILLSLDDVAKIADFGIAKVVNSDTLVGEKKEAVMGSIHYFSPEQAKGTGVDERSDIYSLGIVLYEMVTGRVPFDGATAVEVAVKHMNEEMVPPSRYNPSIPQDVEDIILKSTQKNPDLRYKNADEMITDLSFVKYSRPSDYYLEQQKRKEAGEIDWSEIDTEEKEETPEEIRKRKNAEKAAKKTLREERRKKLLQPQKIIAVVLAVVIAVPVSGVIYNAFFKKEEVVNNDTTVPYLIGMDYEEAAEYALQFDLILEVGEEIYSDEYVLGQIINQSPAEETVVLKGSSVKIDVSKGKNETVVPSVIGKDLAGARTKLEAYGYKVGKISTKTSSLIPEGHVISQNPEAGTSVTAGTTVTLVVSSGSGQTTEEKNTDENNSTDTGDNTDNTDNIENTDNTDNTDNTGTDTTDTNADGETVITEYVSNKDGNYIITIPSGSSGKKIGTILEEAGLVATYQDFVNKLNEMGLGSKLRAGTFKVPESSDVEAMIKILAGVKD